MSHENSNPDYKKDADMPLELIERSALSAIIEVSEQAQSKRRKGDLLYGAIQLPSLSITPEMTQGERAQTVDRNREAYANVLSDSALIKHGIVPDIKNSKVFEMENTGVQYSVRLTEIFRPQERVSAGREYCSQQPRQTKRYIRLIVCINRSG
jgi:hypothetical protein